MGSADILVLNLSTNCPLPGAGVLAQTAVLFDQDLIDVGTEDVDDLLDEGVKRHGTRVCFLMTAQQLRLDVWRARASG